MSTINSDNDTIYVPNYWNSVDIARLFTNRWEIRTNVFKFEDEEVFLCLEGARISERAERKVWVLLNVFVGRYLERG